MLGTYVIVQSYSMVRARPPLIISLQSTGNSIVNFNFPAVALCSNNIISKAALMNYTHFLQTHPKNKAYHFDAHEIEHNLLHLGALLTLALPSVKPNFERFVREVWTDFNITNIMFKLSTNCSRLLKRCSWRGKLEDCDTMFASRLTALGFCCVFNSRYQPEDEHRKPVMLDLIGQDYGLGVVVKEERDDGAYVRRPAYGMEMLIFAGHEYPLVESGDVRMYPIPRNASLYLNIRPFLQYPADEIRYFSEQWRGCRMVGGGLSWCLTRCRRDIARALCGCVPFALQPQGEPHDARTCMLSDLTCLNKHREKFMYLYPGENAHPSLSQELQDALDCPQCRVPCQRQQYSADISYCFYSHKPHVFRNFLSENLSLVNTTVIRMFYNLEHQDWFLLEANTRWYEVTANLCTQWILVTGLTALTYSELFYHCTIRWVYHFLRRTRIANMQPVATSR